ncbi:MAG: CDP-glucose 4,6-dehydratase [Candidatus Goldiibacteriota bacterium HGW-Goldbacteria-1]|jgi:CDP-glucose 4,6-dehydratase|nr:MAG: CDP-glucose 4,6-dehydratase [Candidatus Goldiibacteriota bacterium HGW-Goldbacteria-1]
MLKFYENRKVLITGCTGFKGTWLSRILINTGAVVTGYALEPPTEPSLFKLIKLNKQMKSITGDIRDIEKLSKTIIKEKPEIVIHMAAQPLVRESYKDPVTTYETNVMGTVNILEACRKAPSVRSIVNVTTDKVYENKEWDRGYNEDDVLNGHDPYSNSKSCSELVTSSYKKAFYNEIDNPALSSARSGNVIGGGDFSQDRLIPDCFRGAKAGQNAVIRNPQSTRPYQHVLDCLSGYLLLAEKQYNKKLCGSYNFGPAEGDFVNNEELVKMFCDAWGNNLKYENRPDNGPHEAHFLKLDITKAKQELGWKPKLNVKTAVEMTAQWYKAYLNKEDVVKIMDQQIKDYFEIAD